tara:strand:+ start:152 stop:376 length:225 start_codon:yes stop_codon:yes gene_type:complete
MNNIKLNEREKILLGMSIVLGASLGIIIGRILIGETQETINLSSWNVPDTMSSIIGGVIGIIWFFIRKNIVDKS